MPLHTRLFLRDLTHLDCAYFDPESGLTGDSWSVDAEIGGEPGDDGMLCDFGIVKSTLKAALDADIDHRLLLAAGDGATLSTEGPNVEVVHRTADSALTLYRAPESSVAALDLPRLSPRVLAPALADRLQPRLPPNISTLKLRLRRPHPGQPYRYCHGLRQHQGNCQRMAHGHRARLQIRVDDQRQPALEAQWLARLDGRYIASAADEVTGTRGRRRFAYTASQGAFELELPAAKAYCLDAPPTIESLSRHIAAEIGRAHPGHRVECLSFEGVGKGAISRADD